MQRGGASQGGIVVPPRVDAAPDPKVFSPNDPFNAGMTKGDAKEMPKAPAGVDPNEIAPEVPAVGDMPAEPTPTIEEPDPFK